MKIGVGINIFSGVEFLKPALLNLREHVDYVVGSYSQTSYLGDKIAPYVMPLITKLKNEKLIDELVEFNPPTLGNLQTKGRANYNNSKNLCIKANCTHFMPYDCDELYCSEQLKNLKLLALKYDLVICHLLDYVKYPIYQANIKSPLCVPIIHNIMYNLEGYKYPNILMDISRTIKTNNYFIATDNDIIMHHMTAVRYNEIEYIRKFEGHAHYCGSGVLNKEKHLNNFKNNTISKYSIVPDKFNILEYWENEFTPLYNKYMS